MTNIIIFAVNQILINKHLHVLICPQNSVTYLFCDKDTITIIDKAIKGSKECKGKIEFQCVSNLWTR